jgi:excisionase family DNA binding protein
MPDFEPLSLSPEAAAAYVGLSRRTISRLLADNAITARRCGARTLIDCASLRAYVAALPAYVAGARIPNAPQLTRKPKRKAARKH